MTPHPCMTDFLQAYKTNPEVRGYYDGNHIVYFNEKEAQRKLTLEDLKKILLLSNKFFSFNYIPIENYGYNHLLSSFIKMTEWEKETLKDYFKRYENKD